ncbi:MAG: cadherin-like beta sandwich domain-containing protein [Gammaproteobacteria bacterium]|nr:cadherin-like beta sandwich domain-containing protein [Gammaproteobacteria bacterium]
MLKRFFTGLLAAAAVLFAASAQAQNAPDAPTGATLTPTGASESTSLDFSWTPDPSPPDGISLNQVHLRVFGTAWHSSNDQNRVPTGVTIVGSLSGSGSLSNYMAGTATTATFTNLQPATTYEARVASLGNERDLSGWSAVVQAVTLSGDTPDKPTLTAKSISSQPGLMRWRTTLQWRAAPDSGTISKHHFRWRTAARDPDGTPGNSDDVAAGTWQNAAGDDADCADGAANPENCGVELGAAVTSYEVTGLTDGVRYDFQARSANNHGAGNWSDSLTFTVDGLNSDADLSALVVSDGVNDLELSPAFSESILTYAVSVRSSVLSVNITPTTADASAGVTVGGNAVDSGTAVSRTLDKTAGGAAQGPAENTFDVVVTAENGANMRIYTILVSRQAVSTDASLTALTLSSGSELVLTPAFDPAVFAYTAAVRSHRTGVEITATLSDARGASLKIGRAGFLAAAQSGAGAGQGVDRTDGNAAQDATENTYQVEVTAEDESTQVYEIAVSRMAASQDASLSALAISTGTLSPAFSPGITSYYVAVGNGVAQFTITPTANDSAAGIQVGRAGNLGAATTAQNTEVGGGTRNLFLTVVTAEDGSSRTYTIDMFRAGAITKLLIHDAGVASASRNDANSLLATSDFDPLTPAYSLTVGRAVTAVVVTPTITAGGVNYQRTQPTVTPASATAITSGSPSADIPLAGGENLILFKVSTADYPVTITRPADAPENLRAAPKTQKLRVSWDAVAGTTTYRLRWRTETGPGAWQSAGGADDNGEEIAPADAPQYTITGLTNGTAYQVQARADNRAGDGEWSASLHAAPAVGVEFASQQPDLALLKDRALTAITLPAASGGSSLTYGLTGLPAGLAFDANTRQISGTPSAETAPAAEVTYRVTQGGAVEDEQIFRVRVIAFTLDVDESGARDARDGILIARYLLGVRGAALTQGQSAAAFGELEPEIKIGADNMFLDVDGDGDADGDDGILIARYLFGLRGAELTAGFSGLDAAEIAANIAGLLP